MTKLLNWKVMCLAGPFALAICCRKPVSFYPDYTARHNNPVRDAKKAKPPQKILQIGSMPQCMVIARIVISSYTLFCHEQ